MTIKENIIKRREENIDKLVNSAIDSINTFVLKQYGASIDSHYEVKMGIVKGEKCFEIRLFYEGDEINNMKCMKDNDGYITDFDSTSYEVAEEFAQRLIAELCKQGILCKISSLESGVYRAWNLKINLL